FATLVFSLSLLWLILLPGSGTEMTAANIRIGDSTVFLTTPDPANGRGLSPIDFANTRLSVSGESPSVNPQGALVALSRSL
ncbi:hypothetical protein RCL06_24795, partial [Salmonella enterica subsp. enterica serovar Typhimurium]